jgi:AAA+ ATPase superfamily predicted ATPase
MTTKTATNQDALPALEELFDQLLIAHQAAVRFEDMRRIARVLGEVNSEIKRVIIRRMQDAAGKYEPTFADLKQVNEDLDQIKADIKNITSVIKTATEVISAIVKVVAMLAPFVI